MAGTNYYGSDKLLFMGQRGLINLIYFIIMKINIYRGSSDKQFMATNNYYGN